MSYSRIKKTLHFLTIGLLVGCVSCAQAASIPAPAQDEAAASSPTSRTLVLAGGCFWGIEAVFEHVKGVSKAVSGYAGGAAETAQYDLITGGQTGHAESVEITYNPQEVSLGTLLHVFFSVAHDPTQLNRQGPDVGTHYRSAIFFTDPEQEKIVRDYIAQLDKAQSFATPIVTEVTKLKAFYPAESYHQDYAARNPRAPYIVIHDAPKVENLKEMFPDLYVSQ